MPTDEEIIKGLEAELRLLDEERGPVCTFDVMLELLLSCLLLVLLLLLVFLLRQNVCWGQISPTCGKNVTRQKDYERPGNGSGVVSFWSMA